MKKTIILVILVIALTAISAKWIKYRLSTPTERELLQKIYNEVKN